MVVFTTLMLEFLDVQEKDKVFYFMDRLQYWDYDELKRRIVRDIDDVIFMTEDLMEFQRETTVKKNNGGDHSTPKPQAKQVAPQSSNSKGKDIEGRNKKMRTERGQDVTYVMVLA